VLLIKQKRKKDNAVFCAAFSLQAQEEKAASWYTSRGCKTVGNLLQGDVF